MLTHAVGDTGHVTEHNALPVTPTRYGAKGDGVTDDAGALNACIAAVTAAGGGEIYLPSGTYLINSNLTVNSNTTIRGAGRQTILLTTNSTDRTHISVASGATNVVIRDLACVGPGDQTVASGHEPNAINLVANNTQITVRDCFIKDIAGFGIGVGNGSTDVLIQGNHIEGTGNSGLADGHGISTESANRLIIRDNTIRNCRYRGIEIFSGFAGGSQDVIVAGNNIYNMVATGIAVFASSSGTGFVRGVTVTGNSIDTTTSSSVGQGVWVAFNADHVTVTNNTIQNTGNDGIQVTPQLAGATIKRCTVTGNIVRQSGRYGIYTDGNTFGHVTISNNVVTASWQSGIYLDVANFVTVQGNVCADNGRQATAATDYAGIWGNTASRCTVGGNICRDTRTTTSRTQTVGVYMTNSSDFNAVGGNVATNNVNAQVSLSGTSNQTGAGNITT